MNVTKSQKKLIVNIVIIALIITGLAWVCSMFLNLNSSRFTDNAQVRQHIVGVNCKVQGFVKEIRFNEYSYVHKGDTLLLIEDSEFRLRVAQAEANYRNALVAKSAQGTSIQTTANNIAVSDAAIEEVHANLKNAETNYNRYIKLLNAESVTQQEYDAVETQYLSLKAKYEMMCRQQESTRLMKSEQTQRLTQNDAGIDVAEAALQLANINLSYTVITAPCSGYTSRKEVQVGELVQPGRTLLSIVSDEEYWVLANYRERQMKNIKIGSKVSITVDAIQGKTFTGTVSAISKATGAQYSLVPQDNATGNFVKVEQRIPVKISFDPSNSPDDISLLRTGLNVECKIIN